MHAADDNERRSDQGGDRAAPSRTQGRNAKRLRRKPWPPWSYHPALFLACLIGVPLTKILEVCGVWPRLVSRAMDNMMRGEPTYEPQAHDVLVCSYFKTGTNWTMQIAVQIAHLGRAQFDHIHDVVPWLEMGAEVRYAVPLQDDSAWRSAPTGLRVIKTHLPFDRLTYSPAARYIWVVRDPKDVFVSSYHFLRATMLGPLAPSLERWLNLYLSPDTFTGSWAKHLDGGWRNRYRDNVLFLTYEQMKTDLPGTVASIAAFMGVELTVEQREKVVEQSSYRYMKAIGHKFDTDGLSPPWVRPRGAMVRRGERGTAGELLSSEDQRRIDDYWRAELVRLESDFPYDRVYGAADAAAASSSENAPRSSQIKE